MSRHLTSSNCRARKMAWYVIFWLFAGVLSSGCARKTLDKTAGLAAENLTTLANAYIRATDKNGKPPKGPEDIKPFFPQGTDLEKAFRSARDGEPFVIIWGTNPREGMDLKPMVIGYEKNGAAGTRMVFTAMGVMTMTHASFREARFPAGHSP